MPEHRKKIESPGSKRSQKMIAIVGPTATGKSDLAVALAKRFNGEIISVDSRQVYKGMDLGTGKITKREMRGVAHHLLDVASPARKQIFNVADFLKLAKRKIAQIEKRGRMPILAGGTGFWIDALALNKDFPKVPPDPVLRARFEKLSAEKLFARLQKINPDRAANIDPKNKRRLIRALEIAKAFKGKKIETAENPTHQVLFIGLDLPDPKLEKNIKVRLQKRIKKGLVREAANLHQSGVSWKRLEAFGLEYKFAAQLLQGKIKTEQEMEDLLYTAIRQYAKRQRTWFKRNSAIHWLDAANKKTALRQSFKLVEKFIG